MKNEEQNPPATVKVNENKVPSILVNNAAKYDHERNKKQVKFHKAQNPKPSINVSMSTILMKTTQDISNTAKLSPSIIPPKGKPKQIKRTASWSAGSTEHTKSSGKAIKELEIMKTITHNKVKSKGTITINKPPKVRRNSLQSNPNLSYEKQSKEKNTLQVKARGSRSRSRSPNVPGKKVNEKAQCDKKQQEDSIDPNQVQSMSCKTDTGLDHLISEKIQKFDEIREPQILTRRKSMESLDEAVSHNVKVIAHFMPRRRFSQGAVSALKEVLDNLEGNSTKNVENDQMNNVDPEDFSQLSREEQLKILESKSWIKNIDFNPSSSDLNSLTGGKKAKWKFQDSFYGNFNVGRRPSQDTAWGRRLV